VREGETVRGFVRTALPFAQILVNVNQLSRMMVARAS
jgi:hypothetical protein